MKLHTQISCPECHQHVDIELSSLLNTQGESICPHCQTKISHTTITLASPPQAIIPPNIYLPEVEAFFQKTVAHSHICVLDDLNQLDTLQLINTPSSSLSFHSPTQKWHTKTSSKIYMIIILFALLLYFSWTQFSTTT